MYKVQFLNDAEFESLDYPDMETSLGVADPKTKTAYVRKTGVKVLDAMNLIHELDHLKDGDEGEFAHHKRNGVYYKSFGDIFNTVMQGLSFLPTPLQPAAATYSAVNGGLNAFGGNGIGGGQPKQQEQPQQADSPQVFQQSMPEPQPNAITPQGGGGTQGGGANVGGGMDKALNFIRQQQGNQGNFSGGNSDPMWQFGRPSGRF